MTKFTRDGSNFGADGPFFQVIRQGLEGFAEGEDYFDLLAEDVVFDFVISVPGYPRHVEGRQNIIALYAGYDDYMNVSAADTPARGHALAGGYLVVVRTGFRSLRPSS